MSTTTEEFITPAEYIAREEDASFKSEYHDGKIAALPGASSDHIHVTTNVAGSLRLQMLGRPYRVFANHLRIKVEATDFYTYPDVVVICDQPIIALEGERPNTVLNPLLIVEVMSSATKAADEGTKFDHYRQIPSVRECVLISEHERSIVSYLRPEDGSEEWTRSEVSTPGQLLYLSSIDCTLAVDEVYG